MVQVGIDGAVTSGAYTNGGQVFYIHGNYFGRDSETNGRLLVTYGPPPSGTKYTAAHCAIDTNHTKIACTTVEGTGAGHVLQVTIDGVASLIPSYITLSYGSPTIVSYDGPGSSLAFTRGDQVSPKFWSGCVV